MRIIKYFFFITVFVASISGCATTDSVMEYGVVDWKFYTVGPGGGQWYYNTQSIRQVSEDTVRVWIKLEHLKQEAKFKIRSTTDTLAIALHEFNCNTKQVRQLSCTMYDKNGTVFFSTSNPGPWGPLQEIDDVLFNIVCSSIYERETPR